MSQIIDNTGSIARDHLANERTYLAWLRTGITMMGVGTALVKFNAIIAGIMFNTLGVIFIVLSFFRYKQVSDALIDDKFIINTSCIIIITITSVLLISTSFILLLLNEFLY